jgi:ribulose-phosphate 3-epimerase
MATIFPSLMETNLLKLESIIKELDPYCAGYHLDHMDGEFVPNVMGDLRLIDNIPFITTKKVWVHLMAVDPLWALESLHLPPGSIVSFHFEVQGSKIDIIKSITEKEWLPSMAISPKTDIKNVFPFTQELYQVLVMSVEPGFAGQLFLEDSYDKIDQLVGHRMATAQPFLIGIDGGINESNIVPLKNKGVDQFAVSSAIFGASDRVAALKKLATLIA